MFLRSKDVSSLKWNTGDSKRGTHTLAGGRLVRLRPIFPSIGLPVVPVVFGIAAFHFFADSRPCAVPKMFDVVGDLQRSAGR